MPDDSYNYIAHYMDHWYKFHVMWPLGLKSAVEVAVELATKVFPYLGLQSDNGKEFVNEIVKNISKSSNSVHSHTPSSVFPVKYPTYTLSVSPVQSESHSLTNPLSC